jgi:hypothetical protein
MDPFEDGLRNADRDVPSLVPWTPLTYDKHTWFVLKKLANFVSAQAPHFGDFRNGIMPLDVHRGLDLGWYGHCALVTPAGSRRSSNWLVGFRESCGKDSSCIQSPIELR